MTQEDAPRPDVEAQTTMFDKACEDSEGWTAWRQLLDSGQPALEAALGDPSAVAKRVQRLIVRHRQRRRRRLSLAAALLLACGAAGWFTARRASETAHPLRAALANVVDWENDALDLDLAVALERADALELQWWRSADGLAYMRQKMDALEAEFDSTSL